MSIRSTVPLTAPRTRNAPVARCVAATLAVLAGALAAGPQAHAVDGVIEINQAAVMAGGITILDAPGFPVTLSERGSYRLTGELNVPADTDGILVQNSGVTIDLNGFAIVGGGGSTGRGIFGAGVVRGLRIYNGSVRLMAEQGVHVGPNSEVEHVETSRNGGVGIVASSSSIVRNCRSSLNDGRGIVASASRVESNVVGFNGGDGIDANESVIQNNLVEANGGRGIDGEIGSIVTGNSVRGNGDVGITGEPSSGVGGNVTQANGDGSVAQQVSSTLTSLAPNVCNGIVCP